MIFGFEKVDPTPAMPEGVTSAMLNGRDWESNARAVKAFKAHLKLDLRGTQKARCCFCRRFLGDHEDATLEHFMEKAIHTAFTFEIKNIALSCARCNRRKQHNCSRLWSLLDRFEFYRSGSKPGLRSSAVFSSLAPVLVLPLENQYRWVHPHFHSYSEHILLSIGWIFVPISKQGRRTIRGLGLNEIAELERRKSEEQWMEDGGGELARAVMLVGEVGPERAMEISAAIEKVVRERLGT